MLVTFKVSSSQKKCKYTYYVGECHLTCWLWCQLTVAPLVVRFKKHMSPFSEHETDPFLLVEQYDLPVRCHISTRMLTERIILDLSDSEKRFCPNVGLFC